MENNEDGLISDLLGESDPEDEIFREATEKRKKEEEEKKSKSKKRKRVEKPKKEDNRVEKEMIEKDASEGDPAHPSTAEGRRILRPRVKNPIFKQFEEEYAYEEEIRQKRRMLKKKRMEERVVARKEEEKRKKASKRESSQKKRVEKSEKKEPKKNKKIVKTVDELNAEIKEFIDKLVRVADQDVAQVEKGLPAIKKIQFLPIFVAQLEKKHLYDLFVSNGILNALYMWLEPMGMKRVRQDYTVKLTVLNILDQLPVTAEILETCRIAGIVFGLSNDKGEQKEIRLLANKIVQKWSRMIFNLSSTYKDRESYIYEREELEKVRKARMSLDALKSPVSSKNPNARPGESGFTFRVKPPEKSSYDFVRNPSSPVLDTRPEQSYARSNLAKKLLDIKKQGRPNLKRSKAEVVFLSGSEMSRS